MTEQAEETLLAEVDLAVEEAEPCGDVEAAGGSWRGDHLLSRDPLGEFANGMGFGAQGVNLYAYVVNNPLRYIDPLGEGPVIPFPGNPMPPRPWLGPNPVSPFDPSKAFRPFMTPKNVVGAGARAVGVAAAAAAAYAAWDCAFARIICTGEDDFCTCLNDAAPLCAWVSGCPPPPAPPAPPAPARACR